MNAILSLRPWPLAAVLALFVATSQGAAAAPGVLLLSTGNASYDMTVKGLLDGRFGAGTVTVGPSFSNFDGTTNLAPYNAVLLLMNYNWTSPDMPSAGQSQLLNFIGNGGGLITSEWINWSIASPTTNYFQTLQSALPVVPSGSWRGDSPITYSRVTADSTLDNGVAPMFTFASDSFSGGTEGFFGPKSGATVYYGSDFQSGPTTGAGVIGWTYAQGRVISFSTLAGPSSLNDPNYGRLFGNAVEFVSGTVVPEPSAFTSAGIALAAILAGARWHRRRAA